MLINAVSAGLCSVGANVVNLGVVSTPAVAIILGKYKADAGIMISASHNPSEFNGIKVFSADGFKLPDMLEERVEDIVLEGDRATARPIGGDVGKISYDRESINDYIAHIKNSVLNDLKGLRVAIDCANGSASATARKLFSELGAEIIVMNDCPNGTNINDKCGSTHIEALADFVVKNGYDCGVAFDGDADRCLCVDEKGNVVDGDMIMAICALDMKKRGTLNHNTVVGTIMTNLGFKKFCEANDIGFIATKVGDRYVLEEMLLEGYSLGGEQSGHVIFREFATTGDGQLTAAQLLSLLARSGKKLSELAGVMTRYPQTIINLTVTNEGKLLFYSDTDIKAAMDEATATLGDKGRLVVRPSGTEPLIRVMVEALDDNLANSVAQSVADVIYNKIGLKK
jgi:phosphoglucosamine mutase